MKTHTSKKSPTRIYGGLSEAERINERRERFLDAGLEIFGTLGLRGATVRTLCKAAGLTERYFYESFTDTEALFCAVYERQVILQRNFFIAKLPTLPTDLDARSEASLDMYFTSMRDERVVRVLHLECMTGNEKVSQMHQDNLRANIEVATMLMRIDYPQLQLSDESLRSMAIAINGASMTMAVQWMLDGYSTPQRTLVQACAMVVRGAIREACTTR